MAISAQQLRAQEIEPASAIGARHAWHYVWSRQKIISDVFRLVAFGAAILQIVAFPVGLGYNAFPDSFIRGSRAFPWGGPGYSAAELVPVVLLGGIYSILKIVQPFEWHQLRVVNLLLLSVDVAAGVLLVNLSGGIHSPFILYTLVPVLTASMTKNYMATIVVSVITAIYVLAGNIFNAYNAASNYALTLQAVNDFFVYSIALSLVAVLPYSINLTEVRRLRTNAATSERQRISRDLHDSVCQALCGLRWQVQRLLGRVASDASLSDELKRHREGSRCRRRRCQGIAGRALHRRRPW
ncbi:MAG: histidine kinase dimerization/phosphoacceptor domain-containing protein [Chloroflexi bacterium]|nr:histidine kinase dimerization/phosphoacceptor domain-containing protein [Chloroflexota bacterium]